jgi:monoamine oxidase
MSTVSAGLFILAALTLLAQAQPAPGENSKLPAAVNSTAAPRVIIVGAGLAGVSAARELVDAGIKDVTVLEARSRPGGRLHSVKTPAGATAMHSSRWCCSFLQQLVSLTA